MCYPSGFGTLGSAVRAARVIPGMQTPRLSVSPLRGGKRGLRKRAQLSVVRVFRIWLFNIVALMAARPPRQPSRSSTPTFGQWTIALPLAD